MTHAFRAFDQNVNLVKDLLSAAQNHKNEVMTSEVQRQTSINTSTFVYFYEKY